MEMAQTPKAEVIEETHISSLLNEDLLRRIDFNNLKLNLGCGSNKIESFLNIDSSEKCAPDLVLDIRNGLPFYDNTASEVLLFHTIEHIEEKYHYDLFKEIWRILKPDGSFYLSYPEFVVVAQNYIDNVQGLREFWKNTIYGLQRYAGDYHVALINTEELSETLLNCGFRDILYRPESEQEPFNTIMRAMKGPVFPSYEELEKALISTNDPPKFKKENS